MWNRCRAGAAAFLLVVFVLCSAVPVHAFVMADPEAPPEQTEPSAVFEGEGALEQDSPAEPEVERTPTGANPLYVDGKSLGYLRELAAASPTIEFSSSGVTLEMDSAELIAKLEQYYTEDGLSEDTIFEVELLRDDPTPNGVYIGFYVQARPVPMVFSTPFTARVELEGGYEGLACIGPDGPVESHFDEATGQMVVALSSEGEYIFMLDENLSTRPPALNSEEAAPPEDDLGEAQTQDTQSQDGRTGASEILIRDFLLVVAAAAIGAVVIRIIVRIVLRATGRR